MTLHFTPAMQAHLNVLLRSPQMYTIAMSLMENPHQRLSQVRERFCPRSRSDTPTT